MNRVLSPLSASPTVLLCTFTPGFSGYIVITQTSGDVAMLYWTFKGGARRISEF